MRLTMRLIADLAEYDVRGQSGDTDTPILGRYLGIDQARADKIWAEYERTPNEKVCRAIRQYVAPDRRKYILAYIEHSPTLTDTGRKARQARRHTNDRNKQGARTER